jgi:hypothetical protein
MERHLKPIRDSFERCSWCEIPGPEHEGGFSFEGVGDLSGHFCNDECFKFWVQWKFVLFSYLIKKRDAAAVKTDPAKEATA